MAGLKNIYQQQGFMPNHTISGDTIFDRHLALQSQQYTPFCRICGQVIIEADQDAENKSVDYEMELYYQAHTSCLGSRYYRR